MFSLFDILAQMQSNNSPVYQRNNNFFQNSFFTYNNNLNISMSVVLFSDPSPVI